jgi:signal transduction histidine kinase
MPGAVPASGWREALAPDNESSGICCLATALASMNTALATPTLALAPAAPGGALAAAWPLAVAALLIGLVVSSWVAAGRRGAAPTGQAAGAAGLALHLVWPAGAAGAGLEVLRWALLLPLLPALAGLWRLAPGRWPRLALAAVGLALLLAAGLDAQTAAPTPHWMSLAGLLVAAAIWLGWRWQGRALEARSAEADALVQQRLQAQAAELAATRQQMQRALESAEAAAQARSSFLAAASHDLRQPAHALGLYTAALRAGPLAPEQAEIASRMQASLAALDAMFAALLDVSRIDAGAVAPQWDTVWLAPLLHRLALEWAPQAEARGLRLAVHVSDPLAVTVTDPLLLERVLRNLLANAIKYTRQGGVLLACRARSVADGALGLAHRGLGHGHRHPAGRAGTRVRGVLSDHRAGDRAWPGAGPGPGHRAAPGAPAAVAPGVALGARAWQCLPAGRPGQRQPLDATRRRSTPGHVPIAGPGLWPCWKTTTTCAMRCAAC